VAAPIGASPASHKEDAGRSVWIQPRAAATKGSQTSHAVQNAIRK
jgi:hypothetical protein